MVESVILLVIQICIVIALCQLVIWALARMNVALPPPVVNVVWVIAVLIVVLLLWRAFGGVLSGKIT